MDTATRLAFLLAEIDARAVTMERNAAELRRVMATLREHTGKISANDVHRETQAVAHRCAPIDPTSLWNDAIELMMLLGTEGRA